MLNFVQKTISTFVSVSPDLSNQFERLNLISCLPLQANTNFVKDPKTGKTFVWAQLLCNYTSSYNRIDEAGQVHQDNATLKTLVIKFPDDYLQKYNISTQNFKDFFDKNYVNKKRIILPVTEEKQSYQLLDNKRVPIKNQSEVLISPDFDLLAFFNSLKK